MLKNLTKQIVYKAMESRNRTQAAQYLGIGYRTLANWLRDWGIGPRMKAPPPDLKVVLDYFELQSTVNKETVKRCLFMCLCYNPMSYDIGEILGMTTEEVRAYAQELGFDSFLDIEGPYLQDVFQVFSRRE